MYQAQSIKNILALLEQPTEHNVGYAKELLTDLLYIIDPSEIPAEQPILPEHAWQTVVSETNPDQKSQNDLLIELSERIGYEPNIDDLLDERFDELLDREIHK